MIFKAVEFAAEAHRGQYRKKTQIPYVLHPLAVAEILLENGCSEEVATAAILHDTIEDTAVTLAELRSEFGQAVADLVAGATEPAKSRSWEDRKSHTLSILPTAPLDVLLVVCADKLHNLRSIRRDLAREGASVWERFSRPFEKQKWFFTSMLRGLELRLTAGPGFELVRQLRREVELVFGNTGD